MGWRSIVVVGAMPCELPTTPRHARAFSLSAVPLGPVAFGPAHDGSAGSRYTRSARPSCKNGVRHILRCHAGYRLLDYMSIYVAEFKRLNKPSYRQEKPGIFLFDGERRAASNEPIKGMS